MKNKLQQENATAINELKTLRDQLIEERNLSEKHSE
jgi:hypothetical protein